MDNFFNWIADNYTWIFGGIGVSVLGAIGHCIFKKRNKDSSVCITQKGGKDSINIQTNMIGNKNHE